MNEISLVLSIIAIFISLGVLVIHFKNRRDSQVEKYFMLKSEYIKRIYLIKHRLFGIKLTLKTINYSEERNEESDLSEIISKYIDNIENMINKCDLLLNEPKDINKDRSTEIKFYFDMESRIELFENTIIEMQIKYNDLLDNALK